MCYTIKVGLHVYLDAPSIFFGLITMFNATSGVAVEMKNFSSNVIDKIPPTDVSSLTRTTKLVKVVVFVKILYYFRHR